MDYRLVLVPGYRVCWWLAQPRLIACCLVLQPQPTPRVLYVTLLIYLAILAHVYTFIPGLVGGDVIWLLRYHHSHGCLPASRAFTYVALPVGYVVVYSPLQFDLIVTRSLRSLDGYGCGPRYLRLICDVAFIHVALLPTVADTFTPRWLPLPVRYVVIATVVALPILIYGSLLHRVVVTILPTFLRFVDSPLRWWVLLILVASYDLFAFPRC